MVPPRAPSLLAARADRSALRRERGLACARHRPVHKGVPEESAPQTLLSDPVERGLDPEQGILFVIDGAKVLRKAIRTVFGDAPVQRCPRHKKRNVLDHLPERERAVVKQRLRRAWAHEDHTRALDQLRALASELDR